MLYPILLSVVLSLSSAKGGIMNDPPADSANVINNVNKTKLLQLLNEARKKGCKCGSTYYNPAPPLAWNDLLEKAAFNHAKDMDLKNYFSHTAKDGSDAGIRLERVGYKWKAYGENIGMGYKNEKEVVEGWLSSPGHCKNIMNRKYKEMAVARSGNYWTQTLGSR